MARNNKNKAVENKAVKTEVPKKGVVYTFGGEYYCREDKGLTSKYYEISVTFPELLKAPLSVFKKGVSTTGHPVRNLMIKKYPDFTSVRTYNVISVANNLTSKSVKVNDINVMDIEQLKRYIIENDLGIDVKVYCNKIEKIREIIRLAENNPEKFETVYAKDVEEYEYEKTLEELNNDSDGDAETDGDENGDGDVDDLLDDLEDGGDAETDGDENDTNE